MGYLRGMDYLRVQLLGQLRAAEQAGNNAYKAHIRRLMVELELHHLNAQREPPRTANAQHGAGLRDSPSEPLSMSNDLYLYLVLTCEARQQEAETLWRIRLEELRQQQEDFRRQQEAEARARREREREREEQRRRQQQADHSSHITPQIQLWRTFADWCFEDYSKILKFPTPPGTYCDKPSCKLRRDAGRLVPACDCAVRVAFRTVPTDKLKVERSKWHPDKFSKCEEDKKEAFQKMAAEVFVVVDAMYRESNSE